MGDGGEEMNPLPLDEAADEAQAVQTIAVTFAAKYGFRIHDLPPWLQRCCYDYAIGVIERHVWHGVPPDDPQSAAVELANVTANAEKA
jgi:hypothetical protein